MLSAFMSQIYLNSKTQVLPLEHNTVDMTNDVHFSGFNVVATTAAAKGRIIPYKAS